MPQSYVHFTTHTSQHTLKLWAKGLGKIPKSLKDLNIFSLVQGIWASISIGALLVYLPMLIWTELQSIGTAIKSLQGSVISVELTFVHRLWGTQVFL